MRLHTNVLIYNIVNTLQVENNPGRGRHHGHGPLPHHARPHAAADALPGTAGELCPLTAAGDGDRAERPSSRAEAARRHEPAAGLRTVGELHRC